MKPLSIVLATLSALAFIGQVSLFTSAIWATGYPNHLSNTLGSIAGLIMFIQLIIWAIICLNEGW